MRHPKEIIPKGEENLFVYDEAAEVKKEKRDAIGDTNTKVTPAMLDEYDALELVSDILSDAYDLHVKEFRDLKEKIQKYITERETQLTEAFRTKISEIKAQIGREKDNEIKAKLQTKLQELKDDEDFVTDGVSDLIEQDLKENKITEIDFISYILGA